MKKQLCSDCNLWMQLGFRDLGVAGSQEVIWCPKCKKQILGDILPDQFLEVDSNNFIIEVLWLHGKASTKEIQVIRKLDPNLQDKSLKESVELLRRLTKWRINNLSKFHGAEILWQLRQQGLEADWLKR